MLKDYKKSFLIISILLIFVALIFLMNDENRDVKQPEFEDVRVIIDKQEGYEDYENLMNFVEKEQKFFRNEFNVSLRSTIEFPGEKEKKDLIQDITTFNNVGGICLDSAFQDASKDFETIRYILINKENWKTLTDEGKKLLIYHELVHCGLEYSDHVEFNSTRITLINKRPTYVSNNQEVNCPISLMTSSLFSNEQESCLKNDFDYYLEDIHIRTGR